MSLTDTEDVFLAIHEDGLNDLLSRFFSTRPRYLNYGSPAFVPATTPSATQIQRITFPGVPGGIEWAVTIAPPRVDVHPQTGALPPELTPLGAQRLSLSTGVKLCLDCGDRRRQDGDDRKPVAEEVCGEVEVFAVAHAEPTTLGGEPAVRLVVDAIELVDIKPEGFESVLECLLLKIIRGAIAQAVLPLAALGAGSFQLTPVGGPDLADDHVSLAGTLTLTP